MKNLENFLVDSVFYPCSAFHGTPIKLLGKLNFNKYFYSDYRVSIDDLTKAVNAGLKGYDLAECLDVDALDLFGKTWTEICDWKHRRITEKWDSTYAKWFKFRRLGDYDETHGPTSIELLYASCEGLTAYELAFVHRKIAPRITVHILPGVAFGGNYSDFAEAFNHLLLTNPQSIPKYIFNDKRASEQNSGEYILLTRCGYRINRWGYPYGSFLELSRLSRYRVGNLINHYPNEDFRQIFRA